MNAVALLAGDRELDPTSRVGRYVAHLDARLRTEDKVQQRRTLVLQLSIWTRSYEKFVNDPTDADNDFGKNGPDVADFLFVICAINARLGRL